MQRDGLSAETAQLRLDAQMSIEEKRKLADIVIDNSGTWEETNMRVEQFWVGKGLA
ncbi:Dephospho-CoA kinase [compost metagenome]